MARPVRKGRKRGVQGLTLGGGGDTFSVLVAGWSSLVARRAHNPKVAGSNPAPAICPSGRRSRAAFWLGEPVQGQVAQLVEHTTENRSVGGSIPSLATLICRSVAQLVEHRSPKPAVGGSIPS